MTAGIDMQYGLVALRSQCQTHVSLSQAAKGSLQKGIIHRARLGLISWLSARIGIARGILKHACLSRMALADGSCSRHKFPMYVLTAALRSFSGDATHCQFNV